MSEVKGKTNSANPSNGLLHPVERTPDKPHIASNDPVVAAQNPEKPLESSAPALHPLRKTPTSNIAEAQNISSTHPSSLAQPKEKVSTKQESQLPPEKAPSIQFHSGASSKAAQKIDPFAEQNAKRAEKKLKQDKKRKKIILFSGIIITLIIIAIVIWIIILVTKPEPEPLPVPPVTIENGSLEEITKIQDQAQQIYNDNPNINPSDPTTSDIKVVDQLFDEILDSTGGKEYPNQVLLAQLMFYIQNNYYEQARKVFEEIDPTHLAKDQQALYYNYGGTIYNHFDEKEKASEFYDEASKIRFELGGYGG